MKRILVALILLHATAAIAAALPKKAIELAAVIIELQHRIGMRGHAIPGEADDLQARLSEMSKLVPENRLDLQPELVAFLAKGYAFLNRISPQLSSKAVEQELEYRKLLGGEERPFLRKEIGGATVVLRGDPSVKEVALTFDDGPCAGDGRNNGTANLLDLLKQEDVRATFFLLGDCASNYPRLVQRIAAEGHAIGNHTKSHARLRGLTCLSNRVVEDEIESGEQMILEAMGTEEPLILFRCPYGSGVYDSRVNSILAAKGFYDIYWSIDTNDWRTLSASSSIKRVLNNQNLSGGIILMHERVPDTTIAVKRIIDGLRKRGYGFVTIPQMLGVDNESSARVAYREAAGLYMAGDKTGAVKQLLSLANEISESVLADDALHYAWLIAMETADHESADKIREALIKRFPQSLYSVPALRMAGPAPITAPGASGAPLASDSPLVPAAVREGEKSE